MKNRTYRYADGNVLFPFGYGLTYSRIVCTELRYSDYTAEVTAENIGKADTEDVIQLYIKDRSENAVPNHSLCGFMRIGLRAGEKRTFKIPMWKKCFMAVNEQGERRIFSDSFTLYAGP